MDLFRLFKASESPAPPELVLAYLEEVQASRAPCVVVDVRGTEVPFWVAAIDPDRVHIVPEGPLVVRSGGPVRLLIYLDNLRFEAKAVVAERTDSGLYLRLPHSLELRERRARPRLARNPRENARATLLTGLFEGKSVYGTIENIAVGGVRVQLSSAMSVKRQTAIPLVEDLLIPGEALALVRLEDLYRCPPVELPGKVVYPQIRLGKLAVGVAFLPGYEARLLPLKEYLESRTEPIPRSVPRKQRASVGAAKAVPAEPEHPPAPERHAYRRLPVGADYRLSFRAGGQKFEGLALTEVSAGGCIWRVDRERAEAMPVGTVIGSIFIENGDLPAAELSGRVVQAAAADGGVLVEVLFTDLDPRLRRLFDQHVGRNLGQRGSRQVPGGAAARTAYPSLCLPSGFTARFRHRGTAHTAIPLLEVSAEGCSLAVSPDEAEQLQPGSLLALFKFDHPDLPSIPLQAQVVQVVPKARSMVLQVVFVSLNERVRSVIHAYVLSQIGCLPEPGAQGQDAAGPEVVKDPLPRVSAGPDYSCSFRINGVAFQELPLTDFGANGCGFRVEVQRSGPFLAGAFIHSFHLYHPDLPQVPMQGCIARVTGKTPGRTEGFVLVAMDFVNLNGRLRDIFLDHVVQRLREGT
jgi:hypothetical protein